MSNITSPSEINLEELAARIRARDQVIEQALHDADRNALRGYLDNGDDLLVAQSQMPVGQWERWLKDSCEIPKRRAELYTQLARHRAEIEAALEQDPDLSLREARRLIAKPRIPKSKPNSKSKSKSRGEDLDPYVLWHAEDEQVMAALWMLGHARFQKCKPSNFSPKEQLVALVNEIGMNAVLDLLAEIEGHPPNKKGSDLKVVVDTPSNRLRSCTEFRGEWAALSFDRRKVLFEECHAQSHHCNAFEHRAATRATRDRQSVLRT